VIYVWAH